MAQRRSRPALLLAAALLVAAGFLSPASAATTVVPAAADAYVESSSPASNRGGEHVLRVRGGVRVSYVRFTVPATPAGQQITSATLRVYAKTASQCSLGMEVLMSANATWTETGITWNNQPGATGSVLASAAWASKGNKSFNVTAAVSGMATPGAIGFVIRHASGCTSGGSDAILRSREAASGRPELVIETGAAAPKPACSDGLDNDGDAAIDYPNDPGCATTTDTDETNAPPPPGGTTTLAAAGDIACSPSSSGFGGMNPLKCQHRATANLLASATAVAPLGDLQYPNGALSDFSAAYDPSWGVYAAKSYPVPGNHEYNIAGARGYYDYWASKGRPTGVNGQGYYGFDLGSWHVIALNSNCSQGPSCAEESPQNDWLESDLAATTERCILAYWHHPLFNSGTGHGDYSPVRPLWDDLYAARADIVLTAHEHSYQRYAKQTPTGAASSTGIRQFIVGGGGKSLYALGAGERTLEFADATRFGVLRLTLSSTSYSWQFVSIDGVVRDSGGPVACN